jgi:serine/threonine protein kinase
MQENGAMAPEASKSAVQSVGDYDLVEKIAEGGMGTVYRARQRNTGQVVAIKLVAPHMANNDVFLQRFRNEFNAASKLEHPNVVRALDFGTSAGRPYLVMEFIEGESLGQRLERDGRLSEAEAVRIIVLAARGLEQAHLQGMIHRDVKPDNIMIMPDGQVKLADLGLVKEIDADVNLTRTGRGLGTPHFMAPEQFRNAKNADIRCDIYSLGATLYMMVTGKMPFQALGPLEAWMKKINNELTPARKLVPALSDRTDSLIRRCMDPDPKQRPASCREFIDELSSPSGRKGSSKSSSSLSPQELWYLVFKDEDGIRHMVKGTVAGIRRSLKEGRLGDASNVLAGRTKETANQPLLTYVEFKDLAGTVETPVTAEQTATVPTVGSRPTRADIVGSEVDDADASVTPQRGVRLPLVNTGPGALSTIIKWVALIALAIASGVAAAFLFRP